MRLTPDSEIQVWVKANCNVLGMLAGSSYLVYPSARIELLVKNGQLSWDDPDMEETSGR